MRVGEFLLFLLSHPISFLMSFIVVMLLFIPLLKKVYISIIDPLVLLLFNSIFAYAIPLFLFNNDLCSINHFTFFCFSEIIFWGIVIYSSRKTPPFKNVIIPNEDNYAKMFFYISFFVYIFSSIYTYINVGIPLFMESRQELYVGAESGVGIFSRLADFAQSFVIFYCYHRIITYKERFFSIVFVIVIINCLLSGAKGSILTLTAWFFVYMFFFKKRNMFLKNRKYLLLLLLFPIVVLILYKGSSSQSLSKAVQDLLFRFIANGDVYWMAYPDNVIDNIHYQHPLVTLFAGILGPFRLESYEAIEPSIGIQLFWEVEPSMYGRIMGPNGRLAVTGWCFFGWAGLLLSAIMGWLFSFIVFRSRKYFPNSILGIFVYGCLYRIAMYIIADPALFFSYLSTFIINIGFYATLLLIMSKFQFKTIRIREKQ